MEENDIKDAKINGFLESSILKDISSKESQEMIVNRFKSDMTANLGVKLELPEINNYQEDILNKLTEHIERLERESKESKEELEKTEIKAAIKDKINFWLAIISIIIAILSAIGSFVF